MTTAQIHTCDAISKAEASGYLGFAAGLREQLRRELRGIPVPRQVTTPLVRLSAETLRECAAVKAKHI